MFAHMLPDEMTPEQRRAEIVSILARGFLRLRSSADKSAVNREEDLEAAADKSLYAGEMESIE